MKKVIAITGGGTGGHIYPGLAIAQEIEKSFPGSEIHFVGAQGGLEEKILPQYPYPFHLIRIGRLHSSVGRWQQLKTLLMMPFSLLHAVFIFLSIRPQIVLGVGGFASGPFLIISRLLGAQTALWEANAYPGLTNRLLSRFVHQNFVVFPEAKKFLNSKNVIETGMPVRQEFFERQEPAIKKEKLQVLVFGGSQGAKAINEAILAFVKSQPEILNLIDLKHQTGSRDFQRMKEMYGGLSEKMKLVEYIHNMPQELKAADFVICRAGASTVAEVISSRKPALFIPLPTAADNHQYKNAKVVADQGAALLVEQKNLNTQFLNDILMDFIQSPQNLEMIHKNLQKFDFSKSTQKIVAALIKDKT